MEKMYIKWPAYMDNAGIRRDLEETEPIKKWADLPKKLGRKGFTHATDGNCWDKPYRDHSFYNTEGYRKAKAIVNSSVSSSIQKVREKLKSLIPSYESLDDFLDTNYDKQREDGMIVGRHGEIQEKPDRLTSTWRYNDKYYNLDGFIKGSKKGTPQHHLTKEEIIARKARQLEVKRERAAREAERKRIGDFYFYFRNLPKDLQEMYTKEGYPFNYTYWRLLCYLYEINRKPESWLDKLNSEQITEKLKEIEKLYFSQTGTNYREGIKLNDKKTNSKKD